MLHAPACAARAPAEAPRPLNWDGVCNVESYCNLIIRSFYMLLLLIPNFIKCKPTTPLGSPVGPCLRQLLMAHHTWTMAFHPA